MVVLLASVVEVLVDQLTDEWMDVQYNGREVLQAVVLLAVQMEVVLSGEVRVEVSYSCSAALVTDPMVAAHEAWDYLVQCQVVAPAEEVHGMTVCRLTWEHLEHSAEVHEVEDL